MGLGEDHMLITKSIKNWHKILGKKKKVLADFNSSCPATSEFLESKGLKHVSQLDETGKKDL